MQLNVFFSWQTETKHQGFDNKQIIWESLCKACNEIQCKGDLKNISFNLHEGMRGRVGLENVAEAMESQIANCDIYIADLTITSRLPFYKRWFKKLGFDKSRQTSNTNVAYEIGYAMRNHESFREQMITVLNEVNGNPNDDNKLIFFDIRGLRFPISFYADKKTNLDDVKKGLTNRLKEPLRLAALNAKKNFYRHYHPFISLEVQKGNTKFWGKYFPIEDASTLQNALFEKNQIVRILGLSGIGKTRLVYESFAQSEHCEEYLYYDCEKNEKNIHQVLDEVFSDYKEAYLILDNCEKEMLDFVVQRKRTGKCCNAVITIFNDLEERTVPDVKCFKLEAKYEKVVSEILKPMGNLSEERKKSIEKFADGIPMMAELLVRGISSGRDLGDLGDEALLTKMLGISKTENERVFLQTLSLFSFLGWRDDRREELRCVAESKNITSIDSYNDDVLLNSFDGTINKFITKNIIEQRGRTVGIRPMPLAIYLAIEWLNDCTDERMLAAIKDIQKSTCKERLMQSFHERFRYMGFLSKAKNMLDGMLGATSPFANAEVINTELGSYLFRTFVEVNPKAVASLFVRVFSKKSIEELRNFIDGRRNVVWTLEKLCFDEETFADGASLMLSFANAENETWSNNATGEFVRLFSIYLPATCVNLATRLEFLQKKMQEMQNKEVVLKALSGALNTNHFTYIEGAETFGTEKKDNYEPKDRVEIQKYIVGALDLVCDEIRQESSFKYQAERVLIECFPSVCRFGFSAEMMKSVKEICSYKNNDWDEMLDVLESQECFLPNFLKQDEKEIFAEIKKSLQKKDVFSKIIQNSKSVYRYSSDRSIEELISLQRKKYEELAIEVVDSKGLNSNLIFNLLTTENLNTSPFGKTLASHMDFQTVNQLVVDCIEILNNSPRKNGAFLIDVFDGLENQTFDYLFCNLEELEWNVPLFAILGKRNINVKHKYFKTLKKCIIKKKARVSDYLIYWRNRSLDSWSDQEMSEFFEVVAENPNSFSEVMEIGNAFVFCCNIFDYKNTIEIIKKIVLKNIRSCQIPFVQFAGHVIASLLSVVRDDAFAREINIHLIECICSARNQQLNNYEISQLYTVLLKNYFNEIWHDLSNKLKSNAPEMQYSVYNLKTVFGCVMQENTNPLCSLLFHSDHEYNLLEFCSKNPDVAPARLISMAPIIEVIDNKRSFTRFVRKILDYYGNDKNVLSELSNKLNSYAWTGSLIPLYENNNAILQSLLVSEKKSVVDWAKREIEFNQRRIDRERILEAERGF